MVKLKKQVNLRSKKGEKYMENIKWKEIYEMWKNEFGEDFETNIETVKIDFDWMNASEYDWWNKLEYFENKKSIKMHGIGLFSNSRKSPPTEGMIETISKLDEVKSDPEKTALIWISAYLKNLFHHQYMNPSWDAEANEKIKKIKEMLEEEFFKKGLTYWNSSYLKTTRDTYIEDIERETKITNNFKTQKDIINLTFYEIKKLLKQFQMIKYKA
jgi:hypothetical protein